MASLNQMAYLIAERRGEPLNIPFIETIKFSIKYWYAQLARRDIERNGMSSQLIKFYVLPLIKVDRIDNCQITENCLILRTRDKVEKPIRIKADTDFRFIGTSNGKKIFPAIEFDQIELFTESKYTYNVSRSIYRNDYIYVVGNKKFKWLGLEYVPTNPEVVAYDCSTGNCYDDDQEYPIPMDIFQLIVDGLLNNELRIVNEKEKEIPVDET